MIFLFYIASFTVFVSVVVELIKYEKSDYYKSTHFMSHSDDMKRKYAPDENARERIDIVLKDANDSFRKRNN